MKLYASLETVLKNEPNYVTDDGKLKKWVVITKAQNYDAELIGLLLDDAVLKAKFFLNVKGILVFNQSLFIQFLEQKNYLNDSYTAYKNKIGLTIGDKYLKQRNEVALVWPFKDCVLEGGQSREEDKREEIFFNETLAQDEISQLLEPKVLTNAKRYTANGESLLDKFNRNDKGIITDNLIIKGNNLLALHTLKEEFAGKVKLIYIDPPYNTGNDGFKYNDNFNHSSWLSFMKNRFDIAKDLLSDDGVIFVSLDDKEAHYCKVLMDEIFKRENFIADICHKSRGSISNDKIISPNHNHILLFAKNERLVFSKKEKFGVKKSLEGFKLKDERGDYKLVPVDGPGGAAKGNPFYDFDGIEGYWRFSKEKMQKMYEEGLVVKTATGLQQKYYKEKAVLSKQTVTTWWDENFLTSSATSELKKLMGDEVFKNPKNTNLLKRIVELWTEKEDIVLDYHAGSGTTAHAVLELNKEDGGNRKFIICEQMNYIETVTAERIKKVIANNKVGEFVYFELKKHNQTFVEQIQDAQTIGDLLKIWEEMKAKSFLSYNVDLQKQDAHIDDFKALTFTEQQQHLMELLDKNQLYVNFSSLADNEFDISVEEKKITADFYQIKNK
ncbi:DNA methyltransferase [Flavobacterium sp. ZT3R17]|uniref:DNA methyltransferase n=1 Tax=Flavobacterium cryoconiti TaxID=3398736 RepID=UPI003A877FC0